jgi:5-formyltetrahydrofolate cyclo-ligase
MLRLVRATARKVQMSRMPWGSGCAADMVAPWTARQQKPSYLILFDRMYYLGDYSSCRLSRGTVRRRSVGGMMQAMAEIDPVIDDKAQLRRRALARRDALPGEARAAAAEAIAARPFPVPIAPGTIVSGFIPIRSEINPLPLMRRLSAAGASLALSVVAGRGKPLILRAYAFGDSLRSGQWGIKEPLPEAPEVIPDVMLVPLAAFDRTGHRIGYGAGYYDMTIAKVRAHKPVVAVGIGFAAQEIGHVPATPRDARLDLVLTEREVIDCRNL